MKPKNMDATHDGQTKRMVEKTIPIKTARGMIPLTVKEAFERGCAVICKGGIMVMRKGVGRSTKTIMMASANIARNSGLF